MTNSADPDQLASEEANWSGSALFAKTGHVVLSKWRVSIDMGTSCHGGLIIVSIQKENGDDLGMFFRSFIK